MLQGIKWLLQAAVCKLRVMTAFQIHTFKFAFTSRTPKPTIRRTVESMKRHWKLSDRPRRRAAGGGPGCRGAAPSPPAPASPANLAKPDSRPHADPPSRRPPQASVSPRSAGSRSPSVLEKLREPHQVVQRVRTWSLDCRLQLPTSTPAASPEHGGGGGSPGGRWVRGPAGAEEERQWGLCDRGGQSSDGEQRLHKSSV